MNAAMASQLGLSWTELWFALLTAVGATMIALSRLYGQRQFSTSSSCDPRVHVQSGVGDRSRGLVRTSRSVAVAGLVTLFCLHTMTGWLHEQSTIAHRAVQNRPVVLFASGRIVEHNCSARM